jgi:hypothetical protein
VYEHLGVTGSGGLEVLEELADLRGRQARRACQTCAAPCTCRE